MNIHDETIEMCTDGDGLSRKPRKACSDSFWPLCSVLCPRRYEAGLLKWSPIKQGGTENFCISSFCTER